jgi:uncharacterized membrane protein HdeD (DUF308 family)
MTTTNLPARSTLPATLRRIAFTRFGVAIAWALLVALAAPQVPALLTVLLVLYPLVDAVAVFVELRASGSAQRARASETVNIVFSVLAAIALGWASTISVPAILIVWGIWAAVAGATQLVTGASRRRLGGQWPLIISGGISVLAGVGFLLQGLGGATSASSLSGYAVLGGIFFLISAIRLTIAGRRS